MSIATISKPNRRGRLQATNRRQDDTMATVFMTRLSDTRLQNQFHRLRVLGKNRKVLRTYPLNQQIITVGRSRHSDVHIDDAQVSAKHLTISSANNACVLNDLDSSNGTFVNGQRISGFQVLKDGDEIMIGKTIMQFAERRQETPRAQTTRRRPLMKKSGFIATAMICLAVVAALAFYTAPWNQWFTAQSPTPSEKIQASSPAANPQIPEAAEPPGLQNITQKKQNAYIQMALSDYAAGRIESARETLTQLFVPGPQTPATAQANQILAQLDEIEQTYSLALKAQLQREFTLALEYWDRLMALDTELIGDRPSHFAIQAEERVQRLSYDYALEALQQKNYTKARQLCQVILQIDPQNKQTLALMKKIESIVPSIK